MKDLRCSMSSQSAQFKRGNGFKLKATEDPNCTQVHFHTWLEDLVQTPKKLITVLFEGVTHNLTLLPWVYCVTPW